MIPLNGLLAINLYIVTKLNIITNNSINFNK